MHIFKRLFETARNRRTYRPEATERAGRLAELRAAEILEDQLGETPLRVHPSRRIPDHVTGRRREFDFLLTSPDELVALEWKNWVGRVEERDGRILQHRRDGDVVDHGRLIDSLDDRLRTLRSFLRGRGIDPPPLRSYLVFANPGVELPDTWDTGRHEWYVFSERPDATSSRVERREFLAEALWRLMQQLFEHVLAPETATRPESKSAIRKTRRAIEEAGTWDSADLYGGRTVSGDVEYVVAPDHRLSERSDFAGVTFDVSRSYLDALTRDPEVNAAGAPRSNAPGGRVDFTDLSLDDAAVFLPAGEDHPVEIDLRHLRGIRYGYERRLDERSGWEDLEVGERHIGRVRSVVKFGLFVDIGGPTDGLLHIGDVASGRTSEKELFHRFDEGDVVDVRITGLREEESEFDLHLVHHNPTL